MNHNLQNNPIKPKYTLKEYEAFHLYEMDKDKLIKLICEGYFDGIDSQLINQIISKITKECHDQYTEMKIKRQTEWEHLMANQEYQAKLDKEAKDKKNAEDDANTLLRLKKWLKIA